MNLTVRSKLRYPKVLVTLMICTMFLIVQSSSETGDIAHSRLKALNHLSPYLSSAINELPSDLQSESITLVNIESKDVALPFMQNLITEDRLWKVRIESGIELLLGKDDLFAKHSRETTILLDSSSGKLVHITIRDATIDSAPFSSLDSEDAQAQIEGVGESYVGLPDEPPFTKLNDVLGSASRLVRSAQVIEIDYVDWKYSDKDSRPVWIISVWGLPERLWHIPRGVVGVDYETLKKVKNQDHQRLIFDATTGKLIKRTNVPRIRVSDSTLKK